MSLVTIDDIKINIGSDPINYEGMSGEITTLLTDLDSVFREEESDRLLAEMVSLRKRGVFFPANFMLRVGRGRSSYRGPSSEILDKLVPGAKTLYDEIENDWFKIKKDKSVHTFWRRIPTSIYLCTDLDDISKITPDAFAAIVKTYKDDTGYWLRDLFVQDAQYAIMNKLAQALGRIHDTSAFSRCTRQPKSMSKSKSGVSQNRLAAEAQLASPAPDVEAWVNLYKAWEAGLTVSNTRPFRAAFNYLLNWLKLYPLNERSEPFRFLANTKRSPSFIKYLLNEKKQLSSEEAKAAARMLRFTENIRYEYMAEESEEGYVVLGQELILPHEHKYIDGAWGQDDARGNTAKSVPLPAPWRLKLRDILRRDNYEFARSIADQYFEWRNPKTGKHEKQWIPSLAYSFDVMLEIPLRMMQIRCLDSGEGDALRFIPGAGWVQNDSLAAGYWENDPNAKVKHRGVLKAMGTPMKPIVGFYINTNKTKGTSERYGEFAGYEIPWQNEYVINLLHDLREWQEEYNPTEKPVPLAALPTSTFGYSASESALEQIPDRFYLFRSPNATGSREFPPTYRQVYDFWIHLMDQLEKELREEGEDVTIITERKPDGSPQKAAYHIHGLRVALITALAEAGVPIEVLSKIIVGHSTILMTIYYINHNEAAISKLLNEKALELEDQAEEKMKERIEQADWDEARRLCSYNDEKAFRKALESDILPYWTNVGYGFCPYGSGRCHEGGEPLNEAKAEKDIKYGPVPGGALNCIRCRFFITGLPFALRLWLKAQKLLADAKKEASDIDGFENELDQLYVKRRTLVKAEQYGEHKAKMQPRIRELESIVELRNDKLNEHLLGLHKCIVHLKKIEKDAEASGDKNDLALVRQDGTGLKFDLREGTRFELTTIINKAAESLPFLRDQDMEREQQMFLDTLLLRENLKPLCLAPLSPELKRKAANAAAVWLLENVGAAEVEMLHSGEETLKSLGWSGESLISVIEKSAGPLIEGGTTLKAIGSDTTNG